MFTAHLVVFDQISRYRDLAKWTHLINQRGEKSVLELCLLLELLRVFVIS